ncbi:hypothetical protein NPIL_522821 [Nephila pilipes]|uniref:Uncharacterized protein n=1 Tax=Nephila pilipes TaxID=299642 RepID=A0A8X6KKP9_NEPPI|nr:hypothetical protein NPIL_522821 [Nephila pilipes]
MSRKELKEHCWRVSGALFDRATSPQPGPSLAKPTVVSVVRTDPPRNKRSRSKEEKKSSKRVAAAYVIL